MFRLRRSRTWRRIRRKRVVLNDDDLIEVVCEHASRRLPSFVMVNYYEVGSLFSVVDVLNGFAPGLDGGLAGFPPSAWPDAGAPSDAQVDATSGSATRDAGD